MVRSTCGSRTPGGPSPIGGSVLFEHALTAWADYTLCDRAGRLMAVIEAKRAHTPWLASLSALRFEHVCHVWSRDAITYREGSAASSRLRMFRKGDS